LEELKLEAKRYRLDWGTPVSQLDKFTWEDISNLCSEGVKLVIVDGVVHDVTDFVSMHPGGERYLQIYNGKDATNAFNGSVYEHSNGGRNVARKLRIGVIDNSSK